MLDISAAKVRKAIAHRVGNKLRDEGVHISVNEFDRTQALDASLLSGFLAPVARSGEDLRLWHESDVSLNTLNHYAAKVFDDTDEFVGASAAIAKHLYSCSSHPNIGGGEFIVILFDDIRAEGEKMQALGLFRVESKSEYLDVDENDKGIKVYERSGISLDKVQKGAVVLSNGQAVFAIDSLGQKTKYWVDSFLKAIPRKTEERNSKIAGALLKQVYKKVKDPGDAVKFAHEVEGVISSSQTLSVAEIKASSRKYVDPEEIDDLIAGARIKYGYAIEDNDVIDPTNLAKYARDVVRKSKVSEGVELVVTKAGIRVNSIGVTKTEFGFRAVVDIQERS